MNNEELKVRISALEDANAELTMRNSRCEAEHITLLEKLVELRRDFMTMEATFSLTMQAADDRTGQIVADTLDAARKETASQTEAFTRELTGVFRDAWGTKITR